MNFLCSLVLRTIAARRYAVRVSLVLWRAICLLRPVKVEDCSIGLIPNIPLSRDVRSRCVKYEVHILIHLEQLTSFLLSQDPQFDPLAAYNPPRFCTIKLVASPVGSVRSPLQCFWDSLPWYPSCSADCTVQVRARATSRAPRDHLTRGAGKPKASRWL
jgi:hypothetical protein